MFLFGYFKKWIILMITCNFLLLLPAMPVQAAGSYELLCGKTLKAVTQSGTWTYEFDSACTRVLTRKYEGTKLKKTYPSLPVYKKNKILIWQVPQKSLYFTVIPGSNVIKMKRKNKIHRLKYTIE